MGQLQQKKILQQQQQQQQQQQRRDILKRQHIENKNEEQLAQRRADNIFSVNSFDLKIPKDYEKITKIVFGGRTSVIAVQLSGKRGCALYRWIRAASGDNIAKFKFSAILNIFVDPSGHHILVSADNKVHYVHSSFSQGKAFHLRNFPQDTRYVRQYSARAR